jgi:hypothetical protein
VPFIIPAIAAAIAALTVTEILVIAAVIAVGLAVLSNRNMGGVAASPPVPGTTFTTNPLQLTVSADAPRRMVYGKARLSGVLAYHNVSGDGHEFYTMVIMLAAHPIEAVTQMYFDGKACDDPANSPSYAGFYDWHVFDGTQTTADPYLTSRFPEWGGAMKLEGIAYAVVTLKFDKTVWQNGRPNIQFDIKGKKVYDHRTGLTVWSNNAALCTTDFLMYEDGLQATSDEIDWTLVDAAADISDQLPAGMTSSMCDGRYTIDGVVELSTRAGDVINQMLSAAAGTVVWSDGKYRLYVGATRPPVTRHITVEDFRAEFTLQPRAPADQAFNGVRGTFLDATNNWAFTDFPPVQDDVAIAADGGVKVFRDIVFQFTTSPLTAQRLATIFLRRSRLEKSITLQCKWTCFNYEVWDVVPLDIPALGWKGKLFQIQDWKMTPPTDNSAGGIDLSLLEYDDLLYDDDMSLKPIGTRGVIQVPDVTHPVALSALFATSGISSPDSSGQPFIRFDWPSSSDIYAVGYELAWGKYPFTPVDADYTTFVPGRTSFTLTVGPVNPGDMYVGYIRVVNSFDNRSDPTESNAVVAVSLGASFPEDVTGLTQTLVGSDQVDLAWNSPANPSGVDKAEVRWSPSADGSDYSVVTRVPGSTNTVRLLRQTTDGYYFVGFVNTSGLYGNFASVAVSGRAGTGVLQELAWGRYEDADLTNAIWYTPTLAVVKSQSLASASGWDTFDQMVPNPYGSVSYRAHSAHFTTFPATIRSSGAVGVARAPGVPGSLPLTPASTEVAYFATTVVKDGTYSLLEDANLKIGFSLTHSEPQGVLITGFNGTLEQL